MRTSTVIGLLFLLLAASVARAHGGMWRGPALRPPPSRTPIDPPPGPGGAITPPPRGIPGPAITPPSRPGVPVTPGANVPGRVPGTTPGRALSHWSYWWLLNRERILDLRALQAKRVRESTTAGIPGFFNGASRRNVNDTREKMARQAILEVLRKAAEDGNEDVATGAILALGKAGDVPAIPLLTELVRAKRAHPTVSESAALALGMVGGNREDVRAFLLAVAAGRRVRTRTRAFAVLGLGFLGDPGAIPHLFSLARGRERQRDVPASAYLALGLLRDEIVVPDLAMILLRQGARREKDDTLRAYAAAALGMIRSRAALPALLRALGDRTDEVRRQVVLSLAAIGRGDDRPVVRALLAALATDRDEQTRAFAAVSLGEIGSPASADLLLRAATKGGRVVASYGILGLGLLARRDGNEAVRERVVPFLRSRFATSGNLDQRGALALALGMAGDLPSARRLTAIVAGRGDSDLRGHASMALGLMGAREAAPVLKKVLAAKTDPDLKREVALALGLLGDREAEKILLRLVLHGSTEYVRGGAAVALGRLATPETALALRDIVADPKAPSTTRAFSAVALGMVLDRHPVPLLSRLGEHFNHHMAVATLLEVLSIL